MKTLVYPLQQNSGDVVTFGHFEYKSNRAVNGKTFAARGWPAPLGQIKLYMPTTTPNVANDNGWGPISNPGPIGEMFQDAARTVGAADVGQLAGGVASSAGNLFKNTPGVLHQEAVNMVADKLPGLSANNATQLGQGKIFNPNIELMYDGPRLRQFSMGFDFIPTSAKEAAVVNNIILEFKKWSSASSNKGGSMYSVPHLWKVQYYTKDNPNLMNHFMPAALTKVSVQANSQSDMHATFIDGFPISTSLSLEFHEADVILREDHVAVGGQGY